ncbi:hypothetical protein, variant [Aphanomyces invadans]|uniref:SPX domain-containing protein n=1 Tax=Aphanomyces invadans TaxID=157072 RepID=A0A024TVJ3_9STRA|nr:hypothetical protein, variant [Aphanomyces invadans]ETV98048.1 hypothetical protein, variant [Aphanomyces invadans]|eukprot:XP_008873609.1 hypothetical protein, variant [Aphanomyces invadans]
MVTFKEKLAHNLVPEWEEHYVNYADLKYHVKQIQRRKSFLDMTSGDYTETCDTEKTRLIKTSKPTHFEEEFHNECEKVESWYCAQLEEFQKQYALLKAQYADACATQAPLLVSQEDFDESPESEAFALERHSIKQSFVELYKVLRMLQNFALLNYTALRKVLKKHKKKCGDRYQKAHRSLNDSLHDYAFSHALPVKEAILNLEHYFTTTFHENDRVLALAELDDWKDSTLNWQNVYTGLKMGICIVLALWLLWDDVVVVGLQGQTNPTVIRLMQTSAYPFYRGIALFLFFLWLWGGTLYTWQAARINYRYICELDPHATQDFSQVFDDASHLSMLYLFNFILYVQIQNHSLPEYVPKGYLPLVLALYFVVFFFSKDWGHQRRLARVLRDIVLLPVFPVTFMHTFVCNYLTSAAKINQDFAWSICFFATGEFLEPTSTPPHASACSTNFYYARVAVPLISALPLWWRCVQSLRRVHEMKAWFPGLLNAIKYALSQVVVLFGLFHSFYSPVQPSNVVQLDMGRRDGLGPRTTSIQVSWRWPHVLAAVGVLCGNRGRLCLMLFVDTGADPADKRVLVHGVPPLPTADHDVYGADPPVHVELLCHGKRTLAQHARVSKGAIHSTAL